MALFLGLIFVRDTPLSLSDPGILASLQLAGLVMAAAGGVMAAVQRDFGRFFGYAALSDLGLLLLAVGSGGSQGLTQAMLHAANRAVAITLLAASLSILRHRATTDHFARLQGAARRVPIAAIGLVLGGLSLAGFPFTAGFPTHWAISRAVWNWVQPLSPLAQDTVASVDSVPGQEWVWVLTLIALLASSIGICIGMLRGLSAMLGAADRDDIARQPVVASLMVLALAALATTLAFYPQLLLEPVQNAVEALSLF
jgi:formate hydrogenlyase subunit 3/multisubunit Na+/H+ antiporter MnhD subunit